MDNPISEVFNIDCMEYMKTIPDKFFDLAVVDPPYGLDKSSTHGRGKLKNRALNNGDLHKWDYAPDYSYFQELFRVSKEQIIWGGNYFDLKPSRGFIIWDKMQPWENFSAAEYAWTSLNIPSKIFREATTRTGEVKIHPTQKSIELYKFCLKFAKQGFKILDTHLGSQSSRIAAWDAGLDFYGCELDADYFREGCERFDKHQLIKQEIAEIGYAKTELSQNAPTLF